jgi:YD repeat-containing protein
VSYALRLAVFLSVFLISTPLFAQGSLGLNKSAPSVADAERVVTVSDGHGQRRVVWEKGDGKDAHVVRFREVDGTIWMREGARDSRVWTGQKPGSKFFGDVELLDAGHAIKITDTVNNQEKTYHDDGSWQWTLSSRDTRLPGAESDKMARPKYTLFGSKDGTKILDHMDNTIYWTDSIIPSLQVTNNLQNGEYTFADSAGLTITIAPDGSRTFRGPGGTFETDGGGRQLAQRDGNGKLTHKYHYGRTADGHVYLDQFENNTGLWNLLNSQGEVENAGQRWELQNPLSGKKTVLEGIVFVNRDNDMVTQGATRTKIFTTNGTEISITGNRLTGIDKSITHETTIDVKQKVNGKLVDYQSIIEVTDIKGKLTSKTWKSLAGLFRSQDGKSWQQVDQVGKPIPGTRPWIGDVTIATAPGTLKFPDGRVHHYGAGELIRHFHAPDQNPETLVDGNAEKSMPPQVVVTATSGMLFEMFPDGAEVVRSGRGAILSTRSANGDVRLFDYVFDSAGKQRLSGLTVCSDRKIANQWKWETVRKKDGGEIGGCFRDRDGSISFTKLELSGHGILIERLEDELGDETTITHSLDATTTITRPDETEIVLDSMGRVIQIMESNDWARVDLTSSGEGVVSTGVRIQYDDKGKIAHFDSPAVAVVTNNHQPTAEHLLRSDRDTVYANQIELEGIGDFYLTFERKDDGHVVTVFPDGRLRECALFNGESRLVRLRDSWDNRIAIFRDESGQVQSATITPIDGAATTVLCAPAEKADAQPDQLEPAADVRVVQGEILAFERDGRVWIQSQNPNGTRVELLSDGAEYHSQQVGEQWRLVFARDRHGRESRFAYNTDGKLQSAMGPGFELARDPASGLIQGRVGSYSGDKSDNEHFSDFQIRYSAGVFSLTIDNRLGRDQKTAHAIFDLNRGRYTMVDVDKSSLEFDHKGRLCYESYADDKEFKHVYLDDGGHRRIGSNGSIDDYQLGPDGKERVFYRLTASREEYRTIYNDKTGGRTEIAPGGVIRDYIIDKAGNERIVYEKDSEGNEIKRSFDLEEGRSVENMSDGASTGFDADGRILYHIDMDAFHFNHFYKDDGSKWVEGMEEKEKSAKYNSKVVFDTAGRMTHKQATSGIKADIFYERDVEDGKLNPEDYVPINVSESETEWVRGASIADGSGNFEWTKRPVGNPNAETEEWIGTVEISRLTNPNDIRSTNDASYKLITREVPASPPEVETPVPTHVLDHDDAGRIVRSISADRTTTTDFEWDGDEPKSVTQTVQTADGPSRTVSLRSDEAGVWSDGQDEFDMLLVDSRQGITYFWNAASWHRLAPDGIEVEETSRNGQYWLPSERLSQVVRNTLGQVHSVRNSQGITTVYGANAKGEIISVMQNSSGLIKRPDGAWSDPLLPNKLIRADLAVDHSGRQIWRGQNPNPVVREVAPDGTVTVTRHGGEKTVYSADGSTTTHVSRTSGAIKQIVTNNLDEIRVELRDGSIYQQNLSVASNKIRFIDPNERGSQMDGRLRVFDDGEVQIALPTSTTVYRADGTRSQLATDPQVAPGSSHVDAGRRLEVLRWGTKTKESLRRGLD